MKKISSKVGSIKEIKIIKPKPVKINSKLGKNIKMPKTKKIFEDPQQLLTKQYVRGEFS